MSRYYFNVFDGESAFHDGSGIDMRQTDIPDEVQNLLRLFAYAKVSDDEPPKLVAEVRDEAGRVVYHSSAKLRRRTS